MRWLYSKGINEKRVYALEKITSSLKKCTDNLTKHYRKLKYITYYIILLIYYLLLQAKCYQKTNTKITYWHNYLTFNVHLTFLRKENCKLRRPSSTKIVTSHPKYNVVSLIYHSKLTVLQSSLLLFLLVLLGVI